VNKVISPFKPALSIFITALCTGLIGMQAGPALAETQFKNQSQLGTELNLPVHQWSDPDKATRGVVVLVQALIFDGKAFDAFARHLSDQGYVVYSQDFRGYGDWLTAPDAFGADRAMHFTQSKNDLTKILQTLRQKYPTQKIFCIGESLGANVAIWEASTEPDLLDGVVACGLANKHVRLRPKFHWAITVTKGLSGPKKPFDLKPYMKGVLTEDKSVTAAMLNDKETTTAISPTDLIKANITNTISLKELEKIPPSLPILLVSGAKDRVQRADSLEEVMSRIGSGDKKLMVLKDKGHLLLEHRPVDIQVSQLIDNWLEQESETAVRSKADTAAATSNPAFLAVPQ